MGTHSETAACVRGWAQAQTRCATCPAQPRVRARLFPLIFRLFLFGFCLSKFFSFVAQAATGTPFSFRKENGGKEPRGALPLRTPFQRPAADLPFSRAAGRLKRPFGPQTAGWQGKRLKSQGAELSFSSVFVRGGTFGPTFYIFMEVWRELLPCRRNRSQTFSLLGKTGAVRGPAPGTSRGRAQLGAGKNPVRELLGAAAQVFFGKNG